MAKGERVRVLVVDGRPIVREGTCSLLRGYGDIEVVGEADDGTGAVECVKVLKPDVVLMGASIQGFGDREVTRLLKEQYPDVRVLVLAEGTSGESLFRALSLGASGYVMNGSTSAELVTAVRAIHSRGVYLDSSIARRLIDGFRGGREVEGKGAYYGLTEEEREVLKQIAEGRSNQDVARILGLSPGEVQATRSRIMEKLGLHGRAEMVKYALRAGLLDEERL
jgi:two-component system response regulator NreC